MRADSGARWLALAGAFLVGLSSCAGAAVRDPNGRTYRAWAFGAGHAAAGECDRVSSDLVSTTESTEQREYRVVDRGTLCASASGGHGSPGAWATLAGAFAALFAMLAL
jgi:hypothetical protein